MDRVEADATPAEEWIQSLNAALNRLSTQYLNLLKSGGAAAAVLHQQRSRAGVGSTTTTTTASAQDPPPPSLAASVAVSTLQCQLAAENICVACSNLLSLIRTLRLSLLFMDQDTIRSEEMAEVERIRLSTLEALKQAALLEQELMDLQAKALES